MTDDELRDLLRQSAEETRRHFDVAVEGMRSDIQLLSEGLGARADHFQSRTDEGFREIKVEFDETKALIKLSYSQLDRRIEALERGHRELATRLERLEADRTSN